MLFHWGGRYDLALGQLGDDWLMWSALDGTFVIAPDGSSVRCFVAKPDEPDWQDVLVRRVLPRAAMLFGGTTLHAAAAASGGTSVVLLGHSGAGKSTLSAFLGHRGWDIFSDDITILWDPDRPVAAPATTGVCVWADSRAGLGLPLERCRPMPGYEGKVQFAPGNERAIDPQPLSALIFLARSDRVTAPELQPISPSEGLVRAAQQRIRFNPADEAQEAPATFARLGRIAAATPCYRLRYPARFAALSDVEAVLRSLPGS